MICSSKEMRIKYAQEKILYLNIICKEKKSLKKEIEKSILNSYMQNHIATSCSLMNFCSCP